MMAKRMRRNSNTKSRKIHSLVPSFDFECVNVGATRQMNRSSFGFMNQWINPMNAYSEILSLLSLITYNFRSTVWSLLFNAKTYSFSCSFSLFSLSLAIQFHAMWCHHLCQWFAKEWAIQGIIVRNSYF